MARVSRSSSDVVSNPFSDNMVRIVPDDQVERHGSPASGSGWSASRITTRITRRITEAVSDLDW